MWLDFPTSVGNQEKELTILCTCWMLRSSEQSKKCRSHSKNMWKVCLFYSQNNKTVWLSNMADTFLEKFTRCAKVCGLVFLDCAFECWLAGQTNLDLMVENLNLNVISLMHEVTKPTQNTANWGYGLMKKFFHWNNIWWLRRCWLFTMMYNVLVPCSIPNISICCLYL